MAIVRTVLGDITPEELGITNAHDHIYARPPKWLTEQDPDFLLDDIEKALEEMNLFKVSGGCSFVDATTLDYGRDICALREISEKTEVHIIAITGFNKDRFAKPWVGHRSPNELEELLTKEITEGVEDTGIRCGVVKASSSYNQISSLAESLLRVCARVHKDTGAPILTHTDMGTMGLEQLDIFEEEGVNLERVCIGHCDLNPDPWHAKAITSRGAFVGYDNLGKVKYHPDSHRVDVLKALVEAGYQKHVLLGQDIGRRSDSKAYEGGIGHGWLLERFIPRLREEGLSEEVIRDFLVENPKRWLAF